MGINQGAPPFSSRGMTYDSPKVQSTAESQAPSPAENSPKKPVEVTSLAVKGFGIYQRIEVYCAWLWRANGNNSKCGMTMLMGVAGRDRIWVFARTEAGVKGNAPGISLCTMVKTFHAAPWHVKVWIYLA